MGVSGMGIWELVVILVIVLLLFGTKRLKSIGSDLGNAVRGFRSAMTDGEAEKQDDEETKRLEEAAVKRAAAGEATAVPRDKEKV